MLSGAQRSRSISRGNPPLQRPLVVPAEAGTRALAHRSPLPVIPAARPLCRALPVIPAEAGIQTRRADARMRSRRTRWDGRCGDRHAEWNAAESKHLSGQLAAPAPGLSRSPGPRRRLLLSATRMAGIAAAHLQTSHLPPVVGGRDDERPVPRQLACPDVGDGRIPRLEREKVAPPPLPLAIMFAVFAVMVVVVVGECSSTGHLGMKRQPRQWRERLLLVRQATLGRRDGTARQ